VTARLVNRETMRMRRGWRGGIAIVAAGTCVLLCACSVIFTHAPEQDAAAKDAPDCVGAPVAPVVDLVFVAVPVVAWSVWATAVSCPETACAFGPIIGVGVSSLAIADVVHGFHATAACRAARRRHQAYLASVLSTRAAACGNALPGDPAYCAQAECRARALYPDDPVGRFAALRALPPACRGGAGRPPADRQAPSSRATGAP
jgi:hypothetical protein